MSDPTSYLHEPPPISPIRERARLRPSFFSAMRGIWSFTWKTQLTWRRLPLVALSLLAVPLLIYLTTSPPQAWSKRQELFGDVGIQLNDFARRLGKANLSLEPEQHAQLHRIVSEEYARTENGWREAQSSAIVADYDTAQIRDCYARIGERAKAVLDERQFAQFQTFQKRKMQDSMNRASRPRWSRTRPFYHWLIDFYFFVLLPLNCVRACGGLIRDELQADTLGFLTTRPLSRARLLTVKYLSQTAWLQIVVLAQALLLFAAGQLREIPALGTLLPLFLVTQFLAVFAWSALGTFLGQLTSRYMAIALVYGFIVEMGIGRIPTNINTISIMRHLKTLLAHNPAVHNHYDWPGQGVPLSVGALVLAGGVFLTIATLLFTVKEYHPTTEMQK
jgi:hypothetical protein